MAPVSSQEFLDIQATKECRFTLKLVRERLIFGLIWSKAENVLQLTNSYHTIEFSIINLFSYWFFFNIWEKIKHKEAAILTDDSHIHCPYISNQYFLVSYRTRWFQVVPPFIKYHISPQVPLVCKNQPFQLRKICYWNMSL